jgi:hypothetical protein
MTPHEESRLFAMFPRTKQALNRLHAARLALKAARQALTETQLDEAYSDREPSPHDTPAPWDKPWWWGWLAWGLVIGIAIGGWLT